MSINGMPLAALRAAVDAGAVSRINDMITCFCLILLVLTVPGKYPAAAQGVAYFPLDEGWEWDYIASDGTVLSSKILGFQEVIGVTTVARREVRVGASPDSLENYWTESDSGNVFVHGFENFAHPIISSYDPPILFIDPPLFVGKKWSTFTQAYADLEGTIPQGEPFTITFEVMAFENRQVPAGSFGAFAIGQAPVVQLTARVSSGGYSVAGAFRVSGSSQDMYDWYSDGLGPVEIWINDAYELTSWRAPKTPVRKTSWGALKNVFRDEQ